jgi:hypothetical protein
MSHASLASSGADCHVPAQHHPNPRGAWYADPFEKAAERWWDGHEWTQEVRGTLVSEQDSTDTLDGSAELLRTGQNVDGRSRARGDGSRVSGLRTSWLLRTIAAAIGIATVRRMAQQLH